MENKKLKSEECIPGMRPNHCSRAQGNLGEVVTMSLAKRIHIVGAPGSGKTELAARLSERLDIPSYSLESVLWSNEGKKRRRNTPVVRQRLLLDIIGKDEWIVEGNLMEWLIPSFALADQIIFLTPHPFVRDGRMLQRFLRQKIGTDPDRDRLNLMGLIDRLYWNHRFEYESKPAILKVAEPYKHKLIVTRQVD
ncbi:P-loop NTPase family protein [Paenibacillus shenyangensis]|uniref:DNA topology modulation protein FlaR n=2 Tax=Paenibacillus TaxID=44249 RepID=UPI001EE71042|nr:DNA topology modulation protein FlaR [Paenibacillus sp. A9]